jgi:hypothetical protein
MINRIGQAKKYAIVERQLTAAENLNDSTPPEFLVLHDFASAVPLDAFSIAFSESKHVSHTYQGLV